MRLTLTSVPRPPSSRLKPTLETKFHIDYDWWRRENRDLKAYLISHLPPEKRAQFEGNAPQELIDWIDPETAEVRRLDALQHAIAQAANDPNFLSEHTPLVDAVFRVFLANGNKPLSAEELSRYLPRRSPQLILRTLSSPTVYKGIRPVADE
jgi:hypothetical protein